MLSTVRNIFPRFIGFHDNFLIAINSSETPLPNLPALREKFGGTGAKASSPIARMSIIYDVLNDIIIDADFTPLKKSNVFSKMGGQNSLQMSVF